MKLSGDFEIKLIVVGVGLCGLAFVLYKAGGLAGDALEAVNPLNNDNIINRGVTSVYQGATGSDQTMGADLYDLTHPAAAQTSAGANPVNGAFVSIYQKVTGSKGTPGGDLFDLFH